MRLLAAMLMLAGCSPREVAVEGVVHTAHDDDTPLGGAQVLIRDANGEPWSTTKTDGSGFFAATAPEGSRIYAEISGDDLTPATFSGVSGVQEVFEIEEGELFGFSTAERQAQESLFAGCPGAGAGGPFLVGEVRIFELADPETGEHPLVTTAAVVLENAEASETWDACYLDGLGQVYDPDAAVTGDAGAFAIFGLDEGLYFLVISYEWAPGLTELAEWPVWVPADGVGPFFPAYVSFPL